MNKIIPYILAVCFLVIIVACQSCSRHHGVDEVTKKLPRIDRVIPIDSLQDLFLKQLQNKKIVMIGDGYHGCGSYMQLVLRLLDTWVTELEKEKSPSIAQDKHHQPNESRFTLPRKLIYFVEYSQNNLDTIRYYLGAGNVQGWLMWQFRLETNGHNLSGVPLDDIDYFRNLFALEERVKKLNTYGQPDAYDLLILGPESNPPYSLHKTRDTSLWRARLREFESAKFQYFTYQRDKLAFNNVHDALKKYSNYKAVFFYGAAHLVRGLQNKATLPGTPPAVDTAYGYFLASYLDQEYSRDSVSIIYPISRGYNEIVQFSKESIFPDYELCWNSIPPFPDPLEMINCTLTLHALLGVIKSYDKSSNEEDQIAGTSCIFRLVYQLRRSIINTRINERALIDSLIHLAQDTSQSSKSKRIRIAEHLIKNFDPVKNIDSLDQWITLPLGDSSRYLPMLRMVYFNLPSPKDEETPGFGEIGFDETTKAEILSRKGSLIDYFLINLLHIATVEERDQAIHDLEHRTKLKFTKVDEWDRWWMSRYE